jgi:hypothetical protein
MTMVISVIRGDLSIKYNCLKQKGAIIKVYFKYQINLNCLKQKGAPIKVRPFLFLISVL